MDLFKLFFILRVREVVIESRGEACETPHYCTSNSLKQIFTFSLNEDYLKHPLVYFLDFHIHTNAKPEKASCSSNKWLCPSL